MEEYEKTIIPHIEAIYGSFTALERNIADFFIHNTQEADLSSRHVAQLLFVSEATLSRFAKKCGYRGYREFVFHYEQGGRPANHAPASNDLKTVMDNYQELLNKSYSLMDQAQVERIVRTLILSRRIYVYGKGSSGLAGMEMKLRFMRIGVNIEAITDGHIMRMNSALVDEDCAVIGISVSGKTGEVIDGLRLAARNHAHVILMTSHIEQSFHAFCDEIMLFAVKENLSAGKVISPQFPILVMVDTLYSMMMHSDEARRRALHESTLEVLEEK